MVSTTKSPWPAIPVLFLGDAWAIWSGDGSRTTTAVCCRRRFSCPIECVPNDEVPVLHNVKRGETLIHRCDRGSIEVTCNMTGTWSMGDIIADDCCRVMKVTQRPSLCEEQRIQAD